MVKYLLKGSREEEVKEIESLLPVAVAMSCAFISGSWCLSKGATINASITIEKRTNTLWGSLLSFVGACIVSVGIFIAPIMLLEQISIPSMFISGVLSLLLITLFASTANSEGDEKGVKKALGKIGTIGTLAAIMIVITLVLLVTPNLGGEIGVIPESVWGSLLGTIVMIAGLLTACLAIMAGVKSGGEMLIANEGLSIWALLFVALGEGLAIYGLIISILLIG